jgi:adenylyl-sulfate kinase
VNVASGFTLWLTGLSGAGKTTLALGIHGILTPRGVPVRIFDGDHVRAARARRLGFSRADRDSNVREIGSLAAEYSCAGGVAIAALISPFRDTREEVRRMHHAPFVEVIVACPLGVLAQRDPKGLYAKAMNGEIAHFTGVSDPYEPPLEPEVTVHTDQQRVEESLATIFRGLERMGLFRADPDPFK